MHLRSTSKRKLLRVLLGLSFNGGILFSSLTKADSLPAPGEYLKSPPKMRADIQELNQSGQFKEDVKPDVPAQRVAKTIRIGPGEEFTTPSAAAKMVMDGDRVEIDARGNYENDAVEWTQNNIKLVGINGRPRIHHTKYIPNGKAIWVIKGDNAKVENIEFSGAKVSDRNGAGIRLEGTNLYIKNCYFHNNENGILTGENLRSNVFILNSEFAHNGNGDGRTHNVYIGKIAKLRFVANFSHHAHVGHTLKSRALRNEVLYNRLMDGKDGDASYLVDLSNGGYSIVMGNVIQQSQDAENWTLLAYGLEGLNSKIKNNLYVTFNTFVNNRSSGLFIQVENGTTGIVANNIFAGRGNVLKGKIQEINNIKVEDGEYFVDEKIFDYNLKSSSPFLDKTRIINTSEGEALIPKYQPSFRGLIKRERNGKALDPGAFEYWIF